jgi:acyl-CoA synthetase (AMP-forming)/AMP-acid ligase II
MLLVERQKLDHGRPGMFEYAEGKEIDGAPLSNPENGTCLLLRTSGTTARPKGVPLQQGALITNGAILAASMGLQESDVCYSVMPLFHIGGISASILCTLASGGSVSCDSELFTPDRMVDALAISRPQPTWYSSVPTIHNATIAYLKDVASSDPKYTAYGINSEGIWLEGHSLRMIRSGAAALLGPDGDALAAAYGGVPIYPTYSMSEQMPISQPPAGKTDTFTDKRGSVGVPVAASTAIVSQ